MTMVNHHLCNQAQQRAGITLAEQYRYNREPEPHTYEQNPWSIDPDGVVMCDGFPSPNEWQHGNGMQQIK